MNTSDISHPYRSTIIFLVICLICILSLLTETSTEPLKRIFKQGFYLITYPIVNTKMYVSNFFDYVVEAVFEPDYLRTENKTLKEELMRLRLALLDRTEKNYQLQQKLKISALPKEWKNLTLVHANILEIYQGALRINRGTNDGIRAYQGVIVPEGVVGLIIDTSPFSSVVATLHHRECRIGAMVQRNRLRAYDGVIYPSGDFRKICTMNYIDIYDQIRVGDIIVTSPESIFPPGLPIGTIQSIHESGTLWKSADILPIVDPYRLDDVYIIIDNIEPLDITEIDNMHVSSQLNTDIKIPENTDTTIQELLAP
ncbi:MAG: rod shape-determining protein MreC [Candidatus Hydrogenedens sp.]|nr:rod shape-determining protein MreC [Candidatus Hydrogenedens sp.]